MELITSIIIIVFAVLQIILFFKVWGMTNDVKDLKNKLESKKGMRAIGVKILLSK